MEIVQHEIITSRLGVFKSLRPSMRAEARGGTLYSDDTLMYYTIYS